MTVMAICICPAKGKPMQHVCESVRAIAGVGLENDRYSVRDGTNQGTWKKNPAHRHVSLIELEVIARVNARLVRPWAMRETRRNIQTLGVRLNDLVGKEFLIGEVRVRGTGLCHPCIKPSALSGKLDFEKLFEGFGGLRAEILTSGLITIGDKITIPE